jgi:hypothetical protein
MGAMLLNAPHRQNRKAAALQNRFGIRLGHFE